MKCFSCSVELKPVPNTFIQRRDDYPQYENALVINFRGGYGMYIDPFAPSFFEAVICQDCANDLERDVPWVHELFEAYNQEHDV